MEEFRICSDSDEYIGFLQEKYPNIYSNKVANRTHTRKYIGTVLNINGVYYYVPMSSPKETDYQIAGESKVIKKSIVPIIRIVVKNSSGIKELKGTLRISHMIPVPVSELIEYDIDTEMDLNYKELIKDEWLFIRRNKEKIMNYALVMYKQKNEKYDIGYVKSALEFKMLEEACIEFESRKKEQSEDNVN